LTFQYGNFKHFLSTRFFLFFLFLQKNWMAFRITICDSANINELLSGAAIPSSITLSPATESDIAFETIKKEG
jgi:hypothetical protein